MERRDWTVRGRGTVPRPFRGRTKKGRSRSCDPLPARNPSSGDQSVDLYRSRFAVPLTFPLITLAVALLMIHETTVEEAASP